VRLGAGLSAHGIAATTFGAGAVSGEARGRSILLWPLGHVLRACHRTVAALSCAQRVLRSVPLNLGRASLLLGRGFPLGRKYVSRAVLTRVASEPGPELPVVAPAPGGTYGGSFEPLCSLG
jgi:hypothetical protein